DRLFLLTMHHIVSDGWSMNIFFRELTALYRAYAEAEVSHDIDPLPPLTLDYIDYTVWQRRWLTDERKKSLLSSWMKEISGTPDFVDLPLDHVRPQFQSHIGGSINFTLCAELTMQLREFGRRLGVTPYMVLLSAWSALIGRLADQPRVIIGSPVSDRPHVESESLLGMFINTLALPVDLSDNPTVEEHVRRVRKTVLSALSHKDLPFELLVRKVSPRRTPSYQSLYQVGFTYNSQAEDGLNLPTVASELIDVSACVTQNDLLCSVTEKCDELACTLVYATSLFEETTIRRWQGYWERILSGMVLNEGAEINRLRLVGDQERQDILDVFGNAVAHDGVARDAARHKLPVHVLFEEQVARTPDALAVECGTEVLTYDELNSRANRLAHHLITLGVRPDARVAVCLPKSPDLIIALLAILKAGGAYVPLDPAYPNERLHYMLNDCEPVVVLTLAGEVSRLAPSADSQVVLLDERSTPCASLE
ncbi:condensation domain-containing protein, partial [Pseudomonas amygdali]